MKNQDEAIKKAVVDQLGWDDRVNATQIKVEVEEGKVRLSGTVNSGFERKAAQAAAACVEGGVDISNELVVRYARSEIPDKETIEKNIAMTLSWSSGIDPTGISVVADNGKVSLEGSVDALWKKHAIEEIISRIYGVIAVTNDLTITPGRNVEDEHIARHIISALERNRYVNAETVDIQVQDGVVSLFGTVIDHRARRALENIVRNTSGVREVVDEVHIEQAS